MRQRGLGKMRSEKGQPVALSEGEGWGRQEEEEEEEGGNLRVKYSHIGPVYHHHQPI